jgi:hypothetical protein
VISHHATRHDFSRWVRSVLQDAELAAELAEVEDAYGATGEAAVARRDIVATIERYLT